MGLYVVKVRTRYAGAWLVRATSPIAAVKYMGKQVKDVDVFTVPESNLSLLLSGDLQLVELVMFLR